jgi:hypothetical protein
VSDGVWRGFYPRLEINVKLLTFDDVAERLGCSVKTVRDMRAQLPGAVVVSHRLKFREDAITQFIQRGGCRPVDAPSTDGNA